MQDDEIKIILDNPSRLEWACRRGMLELDVLLGNFLKEAYPTLSLENKILFIKLLSETDPEIFAWIMGHEKPEDANLIKITEMIRHHAQSRF